MIRKPAAILFVLSVAVLALALAPAVGFAAKGGNGSAQGGGGGGKPGGGAGGSGGGDGGSLAVVMVTDQNGNGAPNWNDQMTFDVSTTATDRPWVRLDCYQSGTWVSTSSAGFFPEYPWAPTFTLASGAWTGGAADCTAKLYMVTSNGRSRTLASLSVHVDA